MVPISKAVLMFSIEVSDLDITMLFFLNIIMRDLAGIIAVVGPGLASASSLRRLGDRSAV